jgi:hypothetical protein
MKLIHKVVEIDGEKYPETDTELVFSRSDRGFADITFLDRYEQKCSLQDSSLAFEPAVWLGVINTGEHLSGPNGEKSADITARMHLTQSMVKTLLPYLQHFAETGEYINIPEV